MSFVHMLRDLLWSCVFTKVALYRGLAASSLVISLLIVYGYAFLPLRRVPGPWLSRLFLLRDSAGRPLQGKRLLQLHQKYGTAQGGTELIGRTSGSCRSKTCFNSGNRVRSTNIRHQHIMEEASSSTKRWLSADPQPWRSSISTCVK